MWKSPRDVNSDKFFSRVATSYELKLKSKRSKLYVHFSRRKNTNVVYLSNLQTPLFQETLKLHILHSPLFLSHVRYNTSISQFESLFDPIPSIDRGNLTIVRVRRRPVHRSSQPVSMALDSRVKNKTRDWTLRLNPEGEVDASRERTTGSFSGRCVSRCEHRLSRNSPPRRPPPHRSVLINIVST